MTAPHTGSPVAETSTARPAVLVQDPRLPGPALLRRPSLVLSPRATCCPPTCSRCSKRTSRDGDPATDERTEVRAFPAVDPAPASQGSPSTRARPPSRILPALDSFESTAQRMPSSVSFMLVNSVEVACRSNVRELTLVLADRTALYRREDRKSTSIAERRSRTRCSICRRVTASFSASAGRTR